MARAYEVASKNWAPINRAPLLVAEETDQNVSLPPTCIRRGLDADVILPKLEEDGAAPTVGGGPLFPEGLLRLTMLSTLVASPRSWKVILSVMRISRKKPRSRSR